MKRFYPKSNMKKSFPLRIDQKLWEEIQRWAKDELRSVNGQIEYLLREAVERRKHGSRKEGKRREED
jgi:hypothetical protein